VLWIIQRVRSESITAALTLSLTLRLAEGGDWSEQSLVCPLPKDWGRVRERVDAA